MMSYSMLVNPLNLFSIVQQLFLLISDSRLTRYRKVVTVFCTVRIHVVVM